MEFHQRTLAGGKVWDSLINLKKITELPVQREDEVSGSQMVKHLWKNIAELMQNKENDSSTSGRIDLMLRDLIQAMQGVWDKEKGSRTGKCSSGSARSE